MNNDKSPSKLLDELEFLFDKYSNEFRAMTQPYLLERVKNRFSDYDYHPDDELVRESLMEHVGSLPIMATAFYPYINDDQVNLGEALVMLAVHDIGELVTHDEMTFKKNADSKNSEYEAALSLIDPCYHEAYKDIETQTSATAKFAKAIDKAVPDIIEYFSPAEVTLRRYKHFLGLESVEEIINLIARKKQPYMAWSPFMAEFHKLLLERFKEKLSSVSL